MTKFVVLILALMSIAAFVACETDEEVQGEIRQAEESGAATVISVNAATLMAAYDANEISASAKYEDKIVSVTGVVNEIAEDFLGDAYVTLGSGAQFEFTGVQCYFADSNRADLANLSKGQQATLKGIVKGFLLNVEVRGCTVQ
jgi:hypothetical protein